MGKMSAYAKVLNSRPKQNSKTQIEKRKYLAEHPLKFVVCKKCGRQGDTLLKVNSNYYCKICFKKK